MDDIARQSLISQLRRSMPRDRRGRRSRPPRWLDPRGIERDYIARLRKFAKGIADLVREGLLDQLPDIAKEADRIRPDSADVRLDDWATRIAELVAAIRVTAAERTEAMREAVIATSIRVSNFNAEQRNRIIRSTIGVDVFRAEPWLDGQLGSWAAENASLIRSIPDDLLKDVEGITQRGIRGGRSVRDVSSDIRDRFDVSENRAKLIARDQIGKLNADLTKARQQDLGIDQYIWSTVRDERVRESHEVMDGMICRWDDPSVYREPGSDEWLSRSSIGGVEEHTGVEINCRCSSEPYMDNLLKELTGEDDE